MKNDKLVKCYTEWLENRHKSLELDEVDNMDKSDLVNDFISEVRKTLLDMYEN